MNMAISCLVLAMQATGNLARSVQILLESSGTRVCGMAAVEYFENGEG